MSIFSKISAKRPKRTVFNLSYSSKLSLPFGRLIPIMCEKVVPGDKFVHSHEFLLRFAPFVGQVFQSFHTRVDYFYVPSRLLWSNFEKFLFDNDDVYSHPYLGGALLGDGETSMTGTLVDYFNLPTVNPQVAAPYYAPIDGTAVGDIRVDSLPFRAYLKIFLDYYADENLLIYPEQGSEIDFQGLCDLFDALVDKNGLDADLMQLYIYIQSALGETTLSLPKILAPFYKAYPKDYFTSALPWAQRGPIVQIPLNGVGDVRAFIQEEGSSRKIQYDGIGMTYTPAGYGHTTEVTLFQSLPMSVSSSMQGMTNVSGDDTGSSHIVAGTSHSDSTQQDMIDTVLSNAANQPITFKAVNINGTATISDLRTAMAVQSWLEKNARAGVRYKEQLMAHFGVRSRDYRLDRAQLLQSSKSTVSIGEVFTTAANDDGTFIPGLGVSTATGTGVVKPFKRFFSEHGYVIGLMTVYPTASYYQGIPRQFLELDRFDYYWSEFQHIGEQEIKRVELFVDDQTSGNNSKVFGYTPRYAHYKARTNQVHGDFRQSLQYMYAGRQFANNPSLNMDFININPEKNNLYRVFNYTEDSPFYNAYPCYCDFYHNFKAIRPMSYFGNPRII